MNAPSSVVTSLTNGHTTQVGADTQHNEPFGLLHTDVVGLGVTEGLPVVRAGLLDLALGAVTNEDGLSSPLDDDVLSLRDRSELDLDLGEGENVRGGSHGLEELGDGGFGGRGGDDTHGSDHEVGHGAVTVGVVCAV